MTDTNKNTKECKMCEELKCSKCNFHLSDCICKKEETFESLLLKYRKSICSLFSDNAWNKLKQLHDQSKKEIRDKFYKDVRKGYTSKKPFQLRILLMQKDRELIEKDKQISELNIEIGRQKEINRKFYIKCKELQAENREIKNKLLAKFKPVKITQEMIDKNHHKIKGSDDK